MRRTITVRGKHGAGCAFPAPLEVAMADSDTDRPGTAVADNAPVTGRGRDVFIGRQPIYDRDLNLVAYELLFRSGDVSTADVIDGDQATFTVMLNALVEIGLPRLVGDKKAFINLTRNSVLCEYAQFFPKDSVVMEVLEDVTVDEELLDMVYKFSEQGYEIALDDFVYREELQPLVDLAGMVKIDVQALDEVAVREHVEKFGKMTLLAEKVETEEEFQFCKDLGFELFQGWFLGKPKVIKVKHVPTSQLSTLGLLTAMHQDDATDRSLADIIRTDPALTYRLVRSVNPSLHGGVIDRVSNAVSLIGKEQLERWIMLLSISGQDDINAELTQRSTVRARFCELVAEQRYAGSESTFYLVGQLSLIDEIVGASREELLGSIAVSEEIRDALLDGEGPAALALSCSEALERGQDAHYPALDHEHLLELWSQAESWAAEMRVGLGY